MGEEETERALEKELEVYGSQCNCYGFGWKTGDWLRDNGKAKKLTWMDIRRIILHGNTQSHSIIEVY